MKKYNFKDITIPKPGLVVYGPAWWICKDGDPRQALFYGNSPQCNSNESIVKGKYGVEREDIQKLAPQGSMQAVFVEIAFVPQRQ